jgi:hypothetical protein
MNHFKKKEFCCISSKGHNQSVALVLGFIIIGRKRKLIDSQFELEISKKRRWVFAK